jgi:hypothetical protein
MLRSKRKAAHNAVTRMQEIFDWENMTEDSELFQACAAKIDVEFECELKNKRLKKDRLNVQDNEEECYAGDEHSCDDDDDEEEDEVLTREDLEFVEEDDYEDVDSEWKPNKRNRNPREKQRGSGGSPTRANAESDGSAEEDSAEDSSAEDSSAEDSSAEDSSAEDSSAEDGSAEDEPMGPLQDAHQTPD